MNPNAMKDDSWPEVQDREKTDKSEDQQSTERRPPEPGVYGDQSHDHDDGNDGEAEEEVAEDNVVFQVSRLFCSEAVNESAGCNYSGECY